MSALWLRASVIFAMSRLLSSFSFHRYRCRVTSIRIFNKFDDLMNDVLSGQAYHTKDSIEDDDTAEFSSSNITEWRRIDWEQEAVDSRNQETTLPPSPVDKILVRDRIVYLKRDDQLKVTGSQISGNKARKMLALHRMEPSERFPSTVVSYGGPQSNAMLSLAAIVRYKNEQIGINEAEDKDHPSRRKFVYYTKSLPRFLKKQPSGNLFRAKALGMELIELASDEYNNLFGGEWGGDDEPPLNLQPPCNDSLWIPQGGACGIAVAGTAALAQEIFNFWDKEGKREPLCVVLPGGTCTTAALVQLALHELQSTKPLEINVVVVPCVGDENYAKRQMQNIVSRTNDHDVNLPQILLPTPIGNTDSYFRFAEPHASILRTFREFRDDHDVVLDLLYGAPAWTIMLRHWNPDAQKVTTKMKTSPFLGRQIMYVHSGGLEGINTQLLRYKYKKLIELDEIQLPGRSST